jgi:Bacterial Ig-like domain (group 3)/Galactose oxidase, central domain
MLVFRGMCIALFAFCSSHVFSQSVTEVGSLSQPTVGHSATLLDNGKVLLVAADGRSELFDPTTNTWSLTSSMTVGSGTHSAVKLADGKVLVFGGFAASGSPLSRAELYNPATGAWSTTGSLTAARASNSATLLPNGRVIAVGGQGANSALLASIEEFDPSTAVWTTISSLPQARKGHTAKFLQSGEILLLGGATAFSQRTADCWRFNRASTAFSTCSPIPIARSGHTATKLIDNRILVIGGAEAAGGFESVYDPSADAWSLTPLAVRTYTNHTTSLLRSLSVTVIGGGDSGGSSLYSGDNMSLDSSERFFTSVGTTKYLNFRRAGHTLTALTDGRMLVAGGYSSFNETFFVTNFFVSPKIDNKSFVIDKSGLAIGIGSETGRTPFSPEAGESYLLTISISSTIPITPTGTISVSDGASSCNVTLPSATCKLRTVTAGQKQYIVTYSGDGEYSASTGTVSRPEGDLLRVERAGSVAGVISYDPLVFHPSGYFIFGCGSGSSFPLVPSCDVLFTSGALTLTPVNAEGSTFVGWQGACAGTQSTCVTSRPSAGSLVVRAVFAPTSSLPLKLDIDANGVVDAATDGQLIRRFMSRVHDRALTQSVLGSNPQRTASDEIEDRLNSMTPLLDVDQNGRADAMTDGVVILRFLLGFRNDALTQNAIGVGARRTDPTEISTHLQSMMP